MSSSRILKATTKKLLSKMKKSMKKSPNLNLKIFQILLLVQFSMMLAMMIPLRNWWNASKFYLTKKILNLSFRKHTDL